LTLTLRHVEPAVRPDDVMTGLRSVAELDLGSASPLLTRLEQGLLDEATGRIDDPLRSGVNRI
jgi:hypothetical protein